MKKTLQERLKYFHIRCISCDRKITRIIKESKHEIQKKFVCKDCGERIKVYYNATIPVNTIFLKGQAVVIQCHFTGCEFMIKNKKTI
jgi:cytochrome c-type biogenesis protein CcmE